MENLPQITETVRITVPISVLPYWPDHCFEGNPVLPAVEALQLLAKTVKGFRPHIDTCCMKDARFDKFLFIPTDTTLIHAFVDIALHENGDITAKLLTKTRSQKSSITRIKEHVTVCFPHIQPEFSHPRPDFIFALEGLCIKIPVDKIYRDLVPFGPAYHNIKDFLHISDNGAIAKVYAPTHDSGSDHAGHLGSPFPLDAAFHAACVWGQRYVRTVAFPIGLEKRVIFNRTLTGNSYCSRILPVRTEPDLLVFDIWIYDDNGKIYEGACGVKMRDVSTGRMKPPLWIIDS